MVVGGELARHAPVELVGGPPQAAEENLPIPSAMLGIEAGEWAIPCAGVRNRGGRSPNPDS